MLAQQIEGRGSRSTALQPLIWCEGSLLLTLVSCQFAHAGLWVSIVLMVAVVAVLAYFLWTYEFYKRHDTDALRSERFVLSKIAIHHSVSGDSTRGAPGDQHTVDLPLMAEPSKPLPAAQDRSDR